jgi:hypothetical protein
MSGPNLEAEISPASSPTDNSTTAFAVDHARPATNPPVGATGEAIHHGEGSSAPIAESSTNQAHHASRVSQTIGEPAINESAVGSSQTTADTNQATTHNGQAAANSGEPPETHASSNRDTHGIYVRSPLLMMSCWILGVIVSVGHHLFYKHLDRSIVRGANEEQWNIRFVFPLAYEIGSHQIDGSV